MSFSLHVGADADMTNKINVDIDSMSAAGLGIKGLNVNDKTGEAATYAIDAISDAISKVPSPLFFTVAPLSVPIELASFNALAILSYAS